jgi:hypothetical protein
MTESALGSGASDVVSTPQAEPSAPPSRFRVPVDGEELEVDLEELKRGYSHGRAASKRMQEAAAIRKQEEARKERASKGDFSWLQEYGVPKNDVLKWAEKELLELIEFEALPEPEKNYRTEKQKREALEKQLEELSAKERAQVEQQIADKAFSEIDDEIAKALESYKGKKTPRLIRRVAEAMYANLEKNQEPLPSTKALERAKAGLSEDIQEYLNTSTPQDVIKLFSKEQMAALRKHFVAEAQEGNPFTRQVSAKPGTAQSTRTKPVSTDDFFKKLESKFGR